MAEPSVLEQVPAALRRFVPARFRSDIPIVPVVRLSGAIGISSPLKPGPDARQCGALAGARLFDAQHPRGGAFDQLAGRSGGAVAPDPPAHPRACRREEGAGDRLRRGCRGVRRLHDRLRRRRDRCRRVLDRRLDRRGRRLVRLRQADREDRRRAAALHLGREQGDARSVPAGEAGGRRTPQGDPARNSRKLHRAGEGAARRQARQPRNRLVLRGILDRSAGPRTRPCRRHRRSARRPCASAMATRCARR